MKMVAMFVHCLYLFIVVVVVTTQCKCVSVLGHTSLKNNILLSESLKCDSNNSNNRDDLFLEDAENVIKDFISTPKCTLSSSLSNGGNDHDEDFHIHGWKWHTMSLVHEARRLNQLATKLCQQQDTEVDEMKYDAISFCKALQTVADYTIDFNMQGLHRIENDVFIPIIRQKIQATNNDMKIKNAITSLLNQLDNDRDNVKSLGTTVMREVAIAADTLSPWDTRTRAVERVAINAAAIADAAQRMLRREEELLIPVVSRIFSEQEQKSVNNQVIRKLGIFDSRLHLVGMHEAIVHSSETNNGSTGNNNHEMYMFQKVIPSIPQRLIPRWKRTMYEPRAGALDKLFTV